MKGGEISQSSDGQLSTAPHNLRWQVAAWKLSGQKFQPGPESHPWRSGLWIPAGHGKLKLKKGAMVRQLSRGLIKKYTYKQSHRGGRSKNVSMVRLTLQEYNLSTFPPILFVITLIIIIRLVYGIDPRIKWLLSNPRTLWSLELF